MTGDRPRDAAEIGVSHAFCFIDGGFVEFDPWVYVEALRVRWFHVGERRWEDREEFLSVAWETYRTWHGEPTCVTYNGTCRLQCPGPGSWVAILTADSDAAVQWGAAARNPKRSFSLLVIRMPVVAVMIPSVGLTRTCRYHMLVIDNSFKGGGDESTDRTPARHR